MKRLLVAAAFALPALAAAQGLPAWAEPSGARAPAVPATVSGPENGLGPTLPGPPTPIPVDGGLGLLALAGTGLLAHRIRRRYQQDAR
jgi:hypothetical protein